LRDDFLIASFRYLTRDCLTFDFGLFSPAQNRLDMFNCGGDGFAFGQIDEFQKQRIDAEEFVPNSKMGKNFMEPSF
jgi:hypothetical protein